MNNQEKRFALDTDRLLDAVLADQDWHALDGRLKGLALATMEAATHRRRRQARVARACGAVALLAGAAAWSFTAVSHRIPMTAVSVPAPGPVAVSERSFPSDSGTFISESEMLALFPPGSCVVAEVDGRKELVFFDAQKAAQGFARDR
jgi:hypothetical protein